MISTGGESIDDHLSDPYRPPSEVSVGRTRRSSLFVSINIAAFLWLVLSIQLIVGGHYLRAMFDDLAVELPWLTRFLLHPLASVLCFAIAMAVIASGLTLERPAKRKRLGRIALAAGLIAFLVSLLGMVIPVVSLTLSLS